ncbi:Triosephosphate isomerase [Campylobacter concisus UNSW1]|uniref:triose-phosphate isomerase n=1 Tax=Campylobacter concisus TaxID=199 RepID=UPI0003989D5A|nr:triose-phosphate isomerase [Campylobacter concisus]ERJ23088.1 Triosephosphate isomerase [Campylobacter concisus UNSW1]
MKFLANLKCNHTRASFREYAKILDENLSANDDVSVFAPASAFDEKRHIFRLGAQNFYPCESGAFTGEIGKAMLDEFGIKDVLIGHSERREILNESEELLRAKFDFAAKNGWNVIYCIGENLSTNESGATKEFLSRQLENIDLGYKNLIIAYEPIWAIGTGKSASIEQIDEVLSFLKTKANVPLLYGGSVNAANIADIASIKSCDGVLVGTASWDANNFLNLIRVVS